MSGPDNLITKFKSYFWLPHAGEGRNGQRKPAHSCLYLHFLTTAYLPLIMEAKHIRYHLIKRETKRGASHHLSLNAVV